MILWIITKITKLHANFLLKFEAMNLECIDSLVQDCSISSADALEILQSFISDLSLI